MAEKLDISLYPDEIKQLEIWHNKLESNFVVMREYSQAEFHKDRGRLFKSVQNSGPYLTLKPREIKTLR
jgi:hypothetical protein